MVSMISMVSGMIWQISVEQETWLIERLSYTQDPEEHELQSLYTHVLEQGFGSSPRRFIE
jgi:phage terminase large subunit GpA-like protein